MTREQQIDRRPWYFVSLRWRAVLPAAALVIALVAAGAYLIGDALVRSAEDREIARVVAASQGVMDRAAEFGADQQREAARIAYTDGVIAAMQAGDARVLHPLVEPLAAAADLDVVIVADAAGYEIVGLQRVAQETDTGTESGTVIDYAVSTGTDLAGLGVSGGGSGLVQTEQGAVLLVAQPVVVKDKLIGSVLVGLRLDRVLATLRGEQGIDLALYGPKGAFLRTTFEHDDLPQSGGSITANLAPETVAPETVAPETVAQVVDTPDRVPVSHLMLQDQPYNAAYVPLTVNGTRLGTVGVYRADETLVATGFFRETLAGIAALLVGGVILITFGAMNRVTGRLERITRAADAWAAGEAHAPTGFAPHDEIGELGTTLDRWVKREQERTAALQENVRQQRRVSVRLKAVLQSIPDGLVVQDLEGRVLLINEAARDLLGGQRGFRVARLHDLAAVVAEKLGPVLAPGIYALGDPSQIPLDDKILHAQAAAITVTVKESAGQDGAESVRQQRIGTVIVLRDMTDEVLREQRREELMHTLAGQALAPRSPAAYESLSTLAREVVNNTRAIQGVISELRDLSTFNPRDLATAQRPIPANNLLWHVGAEWEPLARLAQIQVRVLFGPRGLYVLGDEQRLRWALGNAVDNALKFSPPGTTITLAARHKDDHDDNRIEYIVKDEGYGIPAADLPHVFTRFYRGNPCDFEGQPVCKPGTGQGLFIARRVIESHGGDVSIASRVAKGTTVIVRLPLTSEISFDLPDDDSYRYLDEIPAPDTSDTQPREAIIPSEKEFDTVRLEPRRWDRETDG